jgi:hypothetical protein
MAATGVEIGTFTNFWNNCNPESHLPNNCSIIPVTQEHSRHVTAQKLKAQVENAIGTPDSRDIDRTRHIVDVLEQEAYEPGRKAMENLISLHNLAHWLTTILKTILNDRAENAVATEDRKPVLIEIAKNIWGFFTLIKDQIISPVNHPNFRDNFENHVLRKRVEHKDESATPRTIEQLYHEVIN